MHGNCERAREWASLELDGELSSFERALLGAHLETCPSCSAFRMAIGDLTGALRAAPCEPFEGVVLSRVRRRVRMRLAPAAAAMAVAAVGLGSILASVSFRSSPVGRLAEQSVEVSPSTASAALAPDTMNLRTSKGLTRFDRPAGRFSSSSLSGGPVVSVR